MLKVVENSVEQRPATQARFQAPDFASGFTDIARGAANIGQGIGDVASAADAIGKKYDEAAVKQADADDLKQITQIRAEALSAKGFDAQAAIGDARTKITEIRKNRLAGLHNNRQREMYSDVFDQRNLQIEESFASHSVTQIHEAEKQASLARADSYADMAVDTYGTPAFDTNLSTALGEVANVNKGMGAEAIGRQQAKVKSQTYARAIAGMLADPDQVDHAHMALEAHAADILPDDEEKLRAKMNPLLQENQTEADAGWAFTDAPHPKGAESGGYYPTEGPDTPPRAAVSTAADQPHPAAKPISPADPLRGKGQISNTALQHRQRGSGNALDIAAPEGTPIYPPMSGKIAKSWWDQKGGWSVLVEHPNGYVTGYAHLRSKSAYKEGQEVDADTAIGSVGQTGDATGPHVHYTVRQSKGGPKVDPSAALWGPGSVSPASASWKEAEPIRYEAEQNNLGRALTRLHDRAAAENWSPQRYDRAVTRTRQISGVQETLHTQQQDALYQSALSSVVELGDKLTSRSQVPNFGLLEPTHQIAIDNIIKSNKTAEVPANGPKFLTLIGMAQSPEYRKQFLSTDLMSQADITAGERARLWSMQLELKKEPDGSLAASMDQANSYANRYLPIKKFDQHQRQVFMDRWGAAVERQQKELGRRLTPREADDSARALTVDVVRDGTHYKGFEGTGGTVDIQAQFNRIAPDIRASIAQQLSDQGKPSSPRAVVEEWLRSRSR